MSQISIDTFRAALTGGGARGNQYSVQITFPEYAQTGTAQVNSPFLVTAASLPGQQVGVAKTYYRGRPVKLAGDREFQPWTITVINAADFDMRRAFEIWMNGMNGLTDATGYLSPADYQRDIVVKQLDRNGNELKPYVLYDAMPIDISEIRLSFDDNDAIETFDVTFEYQDFETDFPGVNAV